VEMNRDLAATTAGAPRNDMAHSLTDNLWWLLPPAAALFYPQAVRALYDSGKLLHRMSGTGDTVAWLAIAVSVVLVYGVTAVGIGVAYLLGREERTSSSKLLARRISHLAVASPPLFVLIGVVFYLFHAGIAARSGPRSMGCGCTRGGGCIDDHRRTIACPRRVMTPCCCNQAYATCSAFRP